jgi:hypothetical protein
MKSRPHGARAFLFHNKKPVTMIDNFRNRSATSRRRTAAHRSSVGDLEHFDGCRVIRRRSLISEVNHERADLFDWINCSHYVHSFVSRASLIRTARPMTDSTSDLEPPARSGFGGGAAGTIYLEWTPSWVGAIVAAALSFVLLAFGAALGLAVASPSSSWRDTSAVLTLLSGLWLLLTALASFGLGGT